MTHASCYVSDDGSLLFSLELAPKAAKEIQSASCAIEGWMLVHTPYRFLMHYSPLSKAGKNNDQ